MLFKIVFYSLFLMSCSSPSKKGEIQNNKEYLLKNKIVGAVDEAIVDENGFKKNVIKIWRGNIFKVAGNVDGEVFQTDLGASLNWKITCYDTDNTFYVPVRNNQIEFGPIIKGFIFKECNPDEKNLRRVNSSLLNLIYKREEPLYVLIDVLNDPTALRGEMILPLPEKPENFGKYIAEYEKHLKIIGQQKKDEERSQKEKTLLAEKNKTEMLKNWKIIEKGNVKYYSDKKGRITYSGFMGLMGWHQATQLCRGLGMKLPTIDQFANSNERKLSEMMSDIGSYPLWTSLHKGNDTNVERNMMADQYSAWIYVLDSGAIAPQHKLKDQAGVVCVR